jgi:hypothetical protein
MKLEGAQGQFKEALQVHAEKNRNKRVVATLRTTGGIKVVVNALVSTTDSPAHKIPAYSH